MTLHFSEPVRNSTPDAKVYLYAYLADGKPIPTNPSDEDLIEMSAESWNFSNLSTKVTLDPGGLRPNRLYKLIVPPNAFVDMGNNSYGGTNAIGYVFSNFYSNFWLIFCKL